LGKNTSSVPHPNDNMGFTVPRIIELPRYTTLPSRQLIWHNLIVPTSASSTQSLLKEKVDKLINDLIKPAHVKSASLI
jgi:hypothetical protein